MAFSSRKNVTKHIKNTKGSIFKILKSFLHRVELTFMVSFTEFHLLFFWELDQSRLSMAYSSHIKLNKNSLLQNNTFFAPWLLSHKAMISQITCVQSTHEAHIYLDTQASSQALRHFSIVIIDMCAMCTINFNNDHNGPWIWMFSNLTSSFRGALQIIKHFSNSKPQH